jgi:pimeloyl-ACP methyl ester carboxylesterase
MIVAMALNADDPLGIDGVTFDSRWVPVQTGVELLVRTWTPEAPSEKDPLIFIAGWISVIEGWLPVLRPLVTSRRVVYVETREKGSARVARSCRKPKWFSVQRLAEDLVALAAEVGVDDGSAAWFGSSMGANAILEAVKRDRLAVKGAFLVGPNAEFRIPWWAWPILRMPAWWYHLAKYFVIWYIRKFRVDERNEPEQVERYRRSLLSAEPSLLKLSAKAVGGYSVWAGLETISRPVAIAFAPTDTLHDVGEVNQIINRIPNGRAIECESNAYMHDSRIVADVEEFISSLG